MTRAIILMLDSLGVGGAPDADAFGDDGSDTLGHIAEASAGGLRLPFLTGLGLGLAAEGSSGRIPRGLEMSGLPRGVYGHAVERSHGKDTPSGHWEIAGAPVEFDWGYFPDTIPCFPADLTGSLIKRTGVPGVLGDCHASGTEILRRLGLEHLRTGKPIVYTSADSVFQIAAHEALFGLERLYDVCHIARELVDAHNIGRVIARPFIGDTPDTFERTGNRHDYSVSPPSPTLLDRLVEAGRRVHAVGKIGDIFAHKGISRVIKAHRNEALFDATLATLDEARDGDLVFTNFVDFDSVYGHRRDVPGYAAALEALDARLPELESRLRPGDLVLITADHGCDPTWRGTEHTRENVPILVFGPAVAPGSIGRRDTFADMGQTLARHLGLAPLDHGKAFPI